MTKERPGTSNGARRDFRVASQKSSKVTKSKKSYCQKPGLATVAKENASSYRYVLGHPQVRSRNNNSVTPPRPATKTPDQQNPINDTLEVQNVLRRSE